MLNPTETEKSVWFLMILFWIFLLKSEAEWRFTRQLWREKKRGFITLISHTVQPSKNYLLLNSLYT